MANLSLKEKCILEDLFGMSTGYVLSFSNNSFQRFVVESIGIDIYEGPGYEEYCSKAKKLRKIWKDEPDHVVGRLIEDLLLYYRGHELKRKGALTDYEKEKTDEMLLVAIRLLGNKLRVDLATPEKDENLQILMEDINNSLARNKPALALDRLHTFATKMLRRICIENSIDIINNKEEYLPLHSLAGMIKKYYEANQVFQSEFTLLAIRNAISLFDKFNAIRNNQSYAHDNEVLDTIEAEFVVSTMANVLMFIDKLEAYRKRSDKPETMDDLELPF